jgi:hypothetical protein
MVKKLPYGAKMLPYGSTIGLITIWRVRLPYGDRNFRPYGIYVPPYGIHWLAVYLSSVTIEPSNRTKDEDQFKMRQLKGRHLVVSQPPMTLFEVSLSNMLETCQQPRRTTRIPLACSMNAEMKHNSSDADGLFDERCC